LPTSAGSRAELEEVDRRAETAVLGNEDRQPHLACSIVKAVPDMEEAEELAAMAARVG